jgi:septal ring factor EnvC (AmiA/AmiB activator)
MWFKTAKDRLIEYLEAELKAARDDISQLRGENGRIADELAAAERRTSTAEGEEKKRRPVSRFMGDRCRDLTMRSMRGAVARDPKRNLVADLPPPGAVPHGTVMVDGPLSE